MIGIVLNAAGGLALFLLAMAMMTDGLKIWGGERLKGLLRDWTSNALRGVFSGALVTAVVQSSSAVTVATIGFVNAGMLSLRQALGVIFGANVGTTMTGWLVSLVGFGFKIEAFALPILAIGVGLKFLASGERVKGLGEALAGFGLFFLGLAILKDAFSGVADTFGMHAFAGDMGFGGMLAFVGLGVLATVLTQSSSAAIALILTAATESVISVDAAAAAIIGANIGTTSTAVLAAFGATPNAKRVAAGHLVFNLATGVIALLLLSAVLAAVAQFGTWAGVSNQPAPLLALFHTVFNILGVVLLLPFSSFMARRLERLFRSAEEDLGRPLHLDKTILTTPALAIAALRKELSRLLSIVCDLAMRAIQGRESGPARLGRLMEAVTPLSQAIDEFATSVRMENLPRATAEELPRALRVSRYLVEAARLAPAAEALRRDVGKLDDGAGKTAAERVLDLAAQNIVLFTRSGDPPTEQAERDQAFADFQTAYQGTKSALLAAAASRVLGIEQVERLLDSLSRLRRLVEQTAKADHMLRPDRTGSAATEIAPEPETILGGEELEP